MNAERAASPDNSPEQAIERVRLRLYEIDQEIANRIGEIALSQPDLFDVDGNAGQALEAAELAAKREVVNEIMTALTGCEEDC